MVMLHHLFTTQELQILSDDFPVLTSKPNSEQLDGLEKFGLTFIERSLR
jgi:hypothetical protein